MRTGALGNIRAVPEFLCLPGQEPHPKRALPLGMPLPPLNVPSLTTLLMLRIAGLHCPPGSCLLGPGKDSSRGLNWPGTPYYPGNWQDTSAEVGREHLTLAGLDLLCSASFPGSDCPVDPAPVGLTLAQTCCGADERIQRQLCVHGGSALMLLRLVSTTADDSTSDRHQRC